MESENIQKCKEVFENIKEAREELPEESQKVYDQVKEYLTKSEIAN